MEPTKMKIFNSLSKRIYYSHYGNAAEVCFASFHSGGFTTMAVINPPEKNLANRTSVQ
jgi:hypothetical protein